MGLDFSEVQWENGKVKLSENVPVPPAVQCWLERVEGVFPLCCGMCGLLASCGKRRKLGFLLKIFDNLMKWLQGLRLHSTRSQLRAT